MTNTVFQLRRNTVSGTRPTTSTVSPGELAINTTDGILFSANATSIFEIGGNLTSTAIGNSTVRQTVNSTGVYVNGSITLTKNNEKFIFTPTAAAGTGNVYFIQQSDDNFVFYTTNTTGGTRSVFNVFANTNTPNQNSAIRFNTPIDMSSSGFYANNSLGTAGQVLTSNGAGVFWSNVSSSSVNTAAQYSWTNTHSFASNVTFTSATASGNATSGAVILSGGLGVANNIYAAGRFGFSNSTNISVAYQYYNASNNSIDTVFG